jgi:metal-sulfur cluster biosynthetic enzyme
VQAIMGVKNVDVELTFDPVWSIDMLSDEAKAELGLDGDFGSFTASDFLY